MATDTPHSCGVWNLGIPDLASLVAGFDNVREGGVNLDFLRPQLNWNVRTYGAEMRKEMEDLLEKKYRDALALAGTDDYNYYQVLRAEERVDRQALASIPFYAELLQNTIYFMSDRTPHCSLPVRKDCARTFFRLVVGKVGVRWVDDCTPNDLVEIPSDVILKRTKFEQ